MFRDHTFSFSQCIGPLALALSSLGAEVANPKVELEKVQQTEAAWQRPLLGLGAKSTDGGYAEGNIFLNVPIWSTIGLDASLSGSYLFIEPYSSWGEQGEVASSLGLGYRHLFSGEAPSALSKKGVSGFAEEGFYIGASFFADMLDTQFGNRFWQLGYGLEVGSRYLELRGNYYMSLSERKLAERSHQTERRVSSQTQTFQEQSYGDLYATGHSVFQDIYTDTFAVTRTQTTTLRRTLELFETGMEGWDAEVAVLTPWIDQWMDVKFLGGYFQFDNQPFGPQTLGTGNVEGWKAGVEIRPIPALVLSAMWYEDERFVGSDWAFGIGLQVPIGKEWKDAFRLRRRHLVERLAEPVHRQNTAIRTGNDLEVKTKTTQRTKVTRRFVSQTKGSITIAEDVIFVDGNGSYNRASDGTFERPFGDPVWAQNYVSGYNSGDNRVWTIYIQPRPNGQSYGSINVGRSVRLLGSGDGGGFEGLGGKRFGGVGPQPSVISVDAKSGNFSELSVQGLHLTGFLSTVPSLSFEVPALNVANVANLRATNNTFSGPVTVSTTGGAATTAVFSNNQFAPAFGDGAVSLKTGGTSRMDVYMLNNRSLNALGNNIATNRGIGSDLNLFAGGNTFFGGQSMGGLIESGQPVNNSQVSTSTSASSVTRVGTVNSTIFNAGTLNFSGGTQVFSGGGQSGAPVIQSAPPANP
jgi:hypothetical protein